MRVIGQIALVFGLLTMGDTTVQGTEDDGDDIVEQESQVAPTGSSEDLGGENLEGEDLEGDDDLANGEYSYEATTVADRIPQDPFLSRRSVGIQDERTLTEQAPRTVPEALYNSPGAFVQQTNHGGGSPILRGMIGPQNLILIDGVRLNNSVYRTGPLQYLNLIDPLSVSSIEVLRGPGSVLYGSDAMGGVIQVTPLTPRRCCASSEMEAEGEVLLRYGSASLQRTAHVDSSAGVEALNFLGGATFTALDDLTGGRNTGLQPHSGYEDLSVIGNLTYEITEGDLMGSSASAVYLMSRIWDAGRTDKLYDRNSLQMYDNFDDLMYGRFHVRLRPINTEANLALSYQHFFERKDGITVGDDYITEVSTTRDETTVDTLGVDIQLDTWLLDRSLRLQYGGMIYHDSVGSERERREAGLPWESSSLSSYPDGSTYDNFGAFLNTEGNLVDTGDGHVVRLGAGYRFHGMSGHAPSAGGLEAVDVDGTGHVFLGSIQYVYDTDATAAITFSQGFRAPNLQEAVQLGDSGKYFHIPNDDLGPERTDTIEFVARARFTRVAVGVSTYMSMLHDLIRREETTWQGETEVDGKEVAWNVNGGEGLLWGVEGELSLELGQGFSVDGNATFTWGEEDVAGGPDLPLTRIPPLFGQVALRYDTPLRLQWGGFFETYVRAAAQQDRLSAEDESDARIPDGGTPGWWTWNLRGGVTIDEHLQLGLSVENLLNEDYKYHGSGLFAPGTNGVLTLRGSF